MADQTTPLSPNPRPHAEEAALAAVSKHGPHTESSPTLRDAPIGAPQGEVRVISPRHERFVLEFLKDGNATRAYIRAGYSPRGAQPSASRLLRQPHIEAAVTVGRQRVAAALELSVARIGREYARIAFANIDDYIQVEEDGRPRIDLDKASRAQRAGIVELKVSNHRKPEQQVRLKLHKLRALAALTDRMGLFAERTEPTLPSADRARYEHAIAKLAGDWREATIRLIEAEKERDAALAALTQAQAKFAAIASSPSPRMRGEKENNSKPCAMGAPEAPSPPKVAGAGHGTIGNHANRDPPESPHVRQDARVQGLDLRHVARLGVPVDRQAVTLPARQDVDMQVRHALRRARAVGLDQVDAVGRQGLVHRLRYTLRRLRDGAQHVGGDVVHGRPVALGDGERMALVGRIDVHEGDGVVVLIQAEARDRAGDNLAEDAIRISRMRHGRLLDSGVGSARC